MIVEYIAKLIFEYGKPIVDYFFEPDDAEDHDDPSEFDDDSINEELD